MTEFLKNCKIDHGKETLIYINPKNEIKIIQYNDKKMSICEYYYHLHSNGKGDYASMPCKEYDNVIYSDTILQSLNSSKKE